ncbi:aminoglycoside phosphotransferase (APT) family kinase protein [Kribbella rubisoli]|uniref:Aminoglycoside phosphotransferase (APT) family kinase protein n=1 Tax=Kribbella rubisoli TaxID=3075929 RepID=A0A4Q7WPA9_9ACTN|nr:aminoglycoside phosphotransferase family protein [Kribbella rubisoli]RZU12074.1 aminoglycoside phosphotransferase (APT) family kinase protein [Kribbella rubisoli]
MRWLEDGSAGAVAEALEEVGLGGYPVVVRESVGGDPTWWSASAVVGEQYVVKFAWSQPAALRLAHEIDVLAALKPTVPYLPEVVASSTDPLLLATALVPGESLFEVVDSIDRDEAGRQLAEFLGELHNQTERDFPAASLQPATTDVLREQFPKWARPDQRADVISWCDWADDVLATPGRQVLVHGDLHGGNQVWDHGKLRAVVDFETAGLADAEYDLRVFPGTGPGVELLTATMRHYPQELSVERVMAWHLRTALADALWRSEAGVPLPDHRTPEAWVDDLADRFEALGINPQG